MLAVVARARCSLLMLKSPCVQGATQGPCCIAEFRGWMHDLQMDPQLTHALKQFREVAAWKVCDGSQASAWATCLANTCMACEPLSPWTKCKLSG